MTDQDLHNRLNNLMQVNTNTPKLSNLPSKSIVNTSDDLIKQITDQVI